VARTRLAGALALLGALAFAESTGAQAVGGPGGPGSTVGPGVAAGPRFSLRTFTLQALDETGWDWPGADEVAFVCSALGYKLISRECGNVNSDGNARNLKWCAVPAEDRDEDYNHAWDSTRRACPAPSHS
jgi:hypothetical protein